MTLPAIRLARQHLPVAGMTTVVQERYRNALDLSGLELRTLGEIEDRSFLEEMREWRRRLRAGAYDAIVFHRITRPDLPAVVAAFLENIPHRAGGGEKGMQGLLTDCYFPAGRELVVDYHWHLIQAWLRLPATPAHRRWPVSRPSPLPPARWDLLIAPFAQHTKEWPRENWHALLWHARENDLRVALSAGPNQAARAAELIASFPEVENLSIRSKSIGDLFEHVGLARCVVALDTGIRHVAAALAVPCVVLGHGREHRKLFGAYVPTERYLVHEVPCAPCGAEPCPLGHLRCVREIPVGDVVRQFGDLVKRG